MPRTKKKFKLSIY